jgi:hypothetical protein
MDFNKILLDLIKYKNEELSTKGLLLLIKISRQKEEFIEDIKKVELLISKEMVLSYDYIKDELKDLNNIFSSNKITNKEIEISIDIIKCLISEIVLHGNNIKRILRYLNFMDIAMIIFKKNLNQNEIYFELINSLLNLCELVNF